MERPFLSLQKRKRLKAIEYVSGDGETAPYVARGEAAQAYGVATIRDVDILIRAASALNRLKAEGRNDLPGSCARPPTLHQPRHRHRRASGGAGGARPALHNHHLHFDPR